MNDKPHAALFAALDKLLAREKHALLEGRSINFLR